MSLAIIYFEEAVRSSLQATCELSEAIFVSKSARWISPSAQFSKIIISATLSFVKHFRMERGPEKNNINCAFFENPHARLRMFQANLNLELYKYYIDSKLSVFRFILCLQFFLKLTMHIVPETKRTPLHSWVKSIGLCSAFRNMEGLVNLSAPEERFS